MLQRRLWVCLLVGACVDRGVPGSEDATSEAASADSSSSSSSSSGMPTSGGGDETTSTTSGGGDASSTTESPGCESTDIVARVTVPRVMLVLDKSGSMSADPAGYWDHDGDDADDDGFADDAPGVTPATPRVTRWHSLHAVTAGLLDELAGRVDFGAVLFPSAAASNSYDAGACPVEAAPEVAVGPDQAAAILAAIPAAGATDLRGATPTTAGVRTALAGLASDDPEVAERPAALVLVTDGAANCPMDPIDDQASSLFEHYDSELAVVVAEARAAGVPTYVVGVAIRDEVSPAIKDGNPDGVNTFDALGELAEAGGTARPGAVKFYDAGNQVELSASLREVLVGITPCAFTFSYPLAPSLIVKQVTIDELDYEEVEGEACGDASGWRYTDAERAGVELCGAACDAYRAVGDVDLVLTCAPI